MNGSDYICLKQKNWALSRGLSLCLQPMPLGLPPENIRQYTNRRIDNLFMPMTPGTLKDFGGGSGNELNPQKNRPPKIHALHSSSALCCNLFDYWRTVSDHTELLQSMDVSTAGKIKISFEAQLQISPDRKIFPTPPNLDLLIEYQGNSNLKAIGVESKFGEPFGSHSGLKDKYLDHVSWDGIPESEALARRLVSKSCFKRLHAAQLLKHLLGLRAQTRYENKFILLYLYYEVPGPQNDLHRKEMDEFKAILKEDGVDFRALSYQKLIWRLREKLSPVHSSYLEYIMHRYL